MYPGTYARQRPDSVSHVMAGTGASLTYRELDQRSNRLARLLRDRGLRPGDHVTSIMENHIGAFEVYWACIRSGLYLTPVNPSLQEAEVRHILADSDAVAVIATARTMELAASAASSVPEVALRLGIDGSHPAFEDYEEALASYPDTPLAEQPKGEVMFYSSGTTGVPKGIWRPLSGRSVDEGHRLPSEYTDPFDLDEDAVYLSTGPLYHAAALGHATAVQSLGATVVVLERFDAEAALAAIEAHAVTHSQWVPTMLGRLLRLPDDIRGRYDLHTHRIAIHGAAPCPPHVKRQMLAWWGPILVEYYSATEGSGLTIIDSTQWLAHPGSVGRPVIGTIHVCDDDGREVATGTDGLIYFERSTPSFQYHRDAAKTSSAAHPDHPTWTSVGDIGHVDDEGYLYLTDRATFMIVSGGVNIYPAETEHALLEHPAVRDVAVIGVPDDDFGEQVKALVELRSGIEPSTALGDELIEHCRQRLAHYKCPRSVTFHEDLGRDQTGKLRKGDLRAPYWVDADSR